MDHLKAYGDIEMQRRMVSDRVRTDAFSRAIHEVVQPGDVVLDVGTGTGILAMLAAQAGAKKVYAVDATDIADVAQELVKHNGLSDRVQVIRARADTLELDENVDVIISEWLGNAAFGEGMLPAVLAARNANLNESGGRMLPSNVRVMLAPLDDPILYNAEGPGYWREPIHGLDFSALQETELMQGRAVQIRVESGALLAKAQTLLELNLLEAHEDDVWAEIQLDYKPFRDGVLNGFCVWFEADLSPNVLLDTGPCCPATHWDQMYMSFAPRPVRAGETLHVDVDFSFQSDEHRGYVDLGLSVDGRQLTYLID